MNIALAAAIFCLCLLKRKESILLLPVIPLFFSKGLLFVDHSSLPVISFYRFYIFCLILSYLTFFVTNKKESARYNSFLQKPFLFLTASYFLVFIANLNNSTSGIIGVISFLIDVLIPSLLLINMVYYLDKLSLTRWLKFYMYTYMFVALYGIVCYLIDFNPFINYLESTINTGRVKVHTYADTLRGIRAQGTVYHPMNFGALMVFGIFITFVMRKYATINNFLFFFASFTFLIAIFLTNSRSPMIFLFFFILISSLSISLLKKFFVYPLFCIILYVGFISSELLANKLMSLWVIVTPDSDFDMYGSTLAMRLVQLKLSIAYFLDSPILGNGLGFTRAIISNNLQEELHNTESIIFTLLIEFGLVGTLSYFYFFFSQYLVVKKKLYYSVAKSLVIGFIVSYVLFALSTGFLETFHTYVFIFVMVYFFLLKMKF